MARISVGTVTPVLKGDYSPTVTYNRLNLVKYNGTSYCCKVNGAIGISPENTEIWMKMLDSPANADGVSYDNSTSGLEATKVQGAIDEVVEDLGETATALNGTISATQEMISDEWKSGSSYTYKAGEYKIYNNVLKKCKIDCNGSVSFDNDTYWEKTSVGYELNNHTDNIYSMNELGEYWAKWFTFELNVLYPAYDFNAPQDGLYLFIIAPLINCNSPTYLQWNFVVNNIPEKLNQQAGANNTRSTSPIFFYKKLKKNDAVRCEFSVPFNTEIRMLQSDNSLAIKLV